MKIIDKNKSKDYYDFIAGYDTDPRKVYVRQNLINPRFDDIKGVDLNGYFEPNSNSLGYIKPTLYFGEVWFCDKNYRYVHYIPKNQFFWEYEKIPQNIIEWYCKMKNEKLQRYQKAQNLEDNGIMNYFGIFVTGYGWGGNPIKAKMNWEERRGSKINTKIDNPVIFTRAKEFAENCFSSETVLGGILKDIQFNLVKPPQEAFTELYNWIPYHEPRHLLDAALLKIIL